MPTKATRNQKPETREKEVEVNKKTSDQSPEKKVKKTRKEAGKKQVEQVEQVKQVKRAGKTEKPKNQATKELKNQSTENLKNLRTSKSSKKPTTMEELIEATGYEIRSPRPGQVITGMVTDVSKKMVLLDIGAKTEGMVVDREYEAARDYIKELSVGDEVSAYVLSPENERGQILLSLKRALIDRKWELFAQFLETGETVEVSGLEVNKGGMIVSTDTVRGFVPSSQFGKEYLGKMEDLLGKSFKVKVIEVDKEKNRLIFSERHVSEAEAIAKKAEALQFVKADDTYEGVVSGIMPFGVFVGVEVPLQKPETHSAGSGQARNQKPETTQDNVGKVEGLVHISEIAWEKVNDPNDYFKLGDRVKVKVLGVDTSMGKLNLSVKQLSNDPWSTADKKYPSGAKVQGKVSRTAPFGAFVTLEPGVDGLIHISKIPAGSEPKVGDSVDVYVESVDVEQRRMSLGMVLTEVPVGYK